VRGELGWSASGGRGCAPAAPEDVLAVLLGQPPAGVGAMPQQRQRRRGRRGGHLRPEQGPAASTSANGAHRRRGSAQAQAPGRGITSSFSAAGREVGWQARSRNPSIMVVAAAGPQMRRPLTQVLPAVDQRGRASASAASRRRQARAPPRPGRAPTAGMEVTKSEASAGQAPGALRAVRSSLTWAEALRLRGGQALQQRPPPAAWTISGVAAGERRQPRRAPPAVRPPRASAMALNGGGQTASSAAGSRPAPRSAWPWPPPGLPARGTPTPGGCAAAAYACSRAARRACRAGSAPGPRRRPAGPSRR